MSQNRGSMIADLELSARPLDAVFAGGPTGFIEAGLPGYLAAVGGARPCTDADADVHAREFCEIYGVALPPEARALFSAARGHDPGTTFDELRLDIERPDLGAPNLFELLVQRNQLAYLGTELVEAFCGVFGVGSQGNGDTYHMEIYEWDRARQVLHFDHASAAFTGVVADSLDSLVYLAGIVKAGEAGTISAQAYELGLRRLHGRIAPTWQFAIEDKDPAFVRLEPRRRDTEFFFFRSRWICALLKNDGVTDVADVPELFMADLNQVIPPEQLAARHEACERFIPTALYAMWRAYLFDEPELDRYLELSRRHAARLVRDAATLIDELRAGRNELGTIKDVRAWLAAFRALDLDPRRAAARALEAEARAHADAAHQAEIEAELARTPAAQWPALAWRWIDDGVAHRALLRQLDRTARGEAADQIAALAELGDLGDDERAAAIAQLATALSPELEALLIGSLVRDDQLEGALGRARRDDGDDDDGDRAPGWSAIDAALAPIYGATTPVHVATVLPYVLGGNDPLHGISVYPRTEPVPHWHFITYGFTDLFHKETDDPVESGFGFELTLRLARALDADGPPAWALAFLQNLGRYVFGTGNRFAAGHKMGLNGPIAEGHATPITAVCFADDPELGDIVSAYGTARFVQVVGITDDEYRLIQEWSTPGLIEILRTRLPHLITDLDRRSVLDDPVTECEVEKRVAAEGSSEDLTFAGELTFDLDDGRVRIELGALYAAVLPRAMRGRLRHGRSYELRGRASTLHLRPAGAVGSRLEDGELVLDITQELAREIEVQLREAHVGTYDFEAWPALEIVVTPSFIRAQDGTATEVRGIADPVLACRMLAEENARTALAARADDDDDDDDDDDEDDDHDDHDDDAELDDDQLPAPSRVRAALALTERALRLSPDDGDVQFTHAMLLVDGERAALPGTGDELLAWLPRFSLSVRINVAVRLAQRGHDRLGEVVDLALEEAPSSLAFEQASIAHELFGELADAILAHAPSKLARLVPLVPDDATLLSELAFKASGAEQREPALALYDRLLAVPIPDDDEDRASYLRAMNTACVQAHAARVFDAAVRIADRAQPVAHENPYLYHAAACAYVAVGDHARALVQVRLAIEHDYDHVSKVEVDRDLGALLDAPEFKAMFRDWRARQEGN